MLITYEKLTEVSELLEVSSDTYVLVEDGGVVKKILVSNFNNEVTQNEN